MRRGRKPIHCVAPFLITLIVACGAKQEPSSSPPRDPLAAHNHSELRARGLQLANAGDYARGQQYLAAALAAGGRPSLLVPELVRICVADGRLHAALEYALPYAEKHPRDPMMQYLLGVIFLALGETTSAEESFLGAKVRGGAIGESDYYLAEIYTRRDELEQARHHLDLYLHSSVQGRFHERAVAQYAKLQAVTRAEKTDP